MSYEEFKIQNNKDWKKIHHDIFGDTIPKHFEWTNREDIINVLNKIGNYGGPSHMLFPDGGGLDLLGAKQSGETGAIELLTGISYIVKPKKLQFESIDNEFEWNYFRLETKELKPSGVYKEYTENFPQEEVLELTPQQYIERHYWDGGTYNDEPLPETARVVVRFFKGSFVFFKKTSIYNGSPTTYDGRHDKLSAEDFKKHITSAYEYIGNKRQC